MKKQITLNEKEIRNIFKEYFNLDKEPILYFSGGILNPQKIEMIYFE